MQFIVWSSLVDKLLLPKFIILLVATINCSILILLLELSFVVPISGSKMFWNLFRLFEIVGFGGILLPSNKVPDIPSRVDVFHDVSYCVFVV